ncbi:MAG: hypothetical protein AB1656_04570 [Candidatus Omnitrophota bacterium]
MKDKSKRKERARAHDSLIDLEEILKNKEFQEIMKERKNEEIDHQNIPVFHNLLLEEPSFRALMFDPVTTTRIMSEVQHRLQANASLSGKPLEDNQFYAATIHALAPYTQPDIYLIILSRFAKTTKIKRERKLLLWAIADIVATIGDKLEPGQSSAIRAIIVASVTHALEIVNGVKECVDKNPPNGFTYEKILNRSLTMNEWGELAGFFYSHGPDFAFSVSLRAMEAFERIVKPFGFRFFRILHYPDIVKKTPKQKLIVLPGEREQPQEEESQEIQWNRLSQAITMDIIGHASDDIIYEVFQSIQRSAAGAVELPEIRPVLNAAACAFVIPIETNPFLIKLYENSGENAVDINPADELNFILDIKGSPDNPAFYRKYADHLNGKGELEGALSAYVRASELLPQEDESLNSLIKELDEKWRAAHASKQETPVIAES